MEIKDVTTLVLENVENLLLENRIMDIKKKYPKIYSHIIDELVKMGHNVFVESIDFVPRNIPPSSGKGRLCLLEDNDAVIKM